MKRLVVIILIGIVLALLFRRYCFEVVYIATPSMEPAFEVKDELIINKLAYFFKKPQRRDIVMLESPVSDKQLIKRIVGLPEERLSIIDKQVYIDGELLEEEYAYFARPDTLLVGDNIEEFIIPAGHYFIMGDNRAVSRDSRDWLEEEGLQTETVPLSKIKGKRFSLY